MNLIIAGSRRFPSLGINHYSDWETEKADKVYEILKELIKETNLDVTTVVSGECWGMDKLGERWAKENQIPISAHPAEWGKFGKAAGPIRNVEMSKEGQALVCICTPDSKGTNHMISCMEKLGKPFWVKRIPLI